VKDIEKTVAKAVRIELNETTDELFLVFEVVDELFKKKIKDNWMRDVPLHLIGKHLKEK
jgi:hypothetical protein